MKDYHFPTYYSFDLDTRTVHYGHGIKMVRIQDRRFRISGSLPYYKIVGSHLYSYYGDLAVLRGCSSWVVQQLESLLHEGV
jgi:hypothetical protein